MPALPSGIRAASPLNASDDSRLLFTADTTETLSRALDNMPSAFLTMDSGLQVQVEYSQTGRADDTLGLSVRIVNGATILAAANAGGTFQNVNANVTNTTDTTTTPTFGFVNTSANKATWDGATIELAQTYGQNMGKDGCLIRVDTIQLVGNYTELVGNNFTEDLSTSIVATVDVLDRFPEVRRGRLMVELAPLAWWRFGDGSGTDDHSGNGRDLVWDAAGEPQHFSDTPIPGGHGSGDLDGSTFATVLNEAGLELFEDMAIEAWVKPLDNISSGLSIAAVWDSTNGFLWQHYWNGVSDTYGARPTSADGGVVTFPGDMGTEIGEWSHQVVHFLWDGQGMRSIRVFQEGAFRITRLDGHQSMTASYKYEPAAGTRAVLIAGLSTPQALFAGRLAEIVIYQGKVRPSQMRDLYNSEYLAATETLSTTITATTTVIDTLDEGGFEETLDTDIVASTTAADQLAATETLASSIIASTTEADAAALPEALSTSVVGTTTVVDVHTFTESLATSGVVAITSADQLSASETLATSVVATTTSVDTYTPGAQQHQEDLQTAIVATTSFTDHLAATETRSTSVVAVVTMLDEVVQRETASVAITATVTSADQRSMFETLATSGTTTTTLVDDLALSEVLATSIVATTTSAEQIRQLEALATSIIGSTTAVEDLSMFEALATTATATTAISDTAAFTNTDAGFFFDFFEGPSLDLAGNWSGFFEDGWAHNGSGELVYPANNPGGDSFITSTPIPELGSGFDMRAEIVQPLGFSGSPAGGDFAFIELSVKNIGMTVYEDPVSGQVLRFFEAGDTVGSDIPYDTTNHRWWRIVFDGADATFLTSPGEHGPWTVQHTEVGISAGAANVIFLYADAFGEDEDGIIGSIRLRGAPETRVRATTTFVDAFTVVERGRKGYVLTLDPVAWYRLSNSVQTADVGPEGDHGLTWFGSPSFTDLAPGSTPLEGSEGFVSLDGSTQYAEIANEDDLELHADMSLELICRADAVTGAIQAVVNARGSGTHRNLWAIYYDPDGNHYEFYPTTAAASNVIVLPAGDGDWVHVIVSIDWDGSGNRRIRTLSRNITDDTAPSGVNNTYAYQPGVITRQTRIGQEGTDGGSFFDGDVSEFLVYDQALDFSDMERLLNTVYFREVLQTSITATTTSQDQIGGAFTEFLETSIAAATTSADTLAATEAESTQIAAETTSAELLGASEALNTSISAQTTAEDARSASETLATALGGATTSADLLAATEALSTQLTATTTEADTRSLTESLTTSGVAQTTVTDTLGASDSVTTNIVATTTAVDSFTGSTLEVLFTTGTVATTSGDVLTAFETAATQITATVTEADQLGYSDQITVNVVATTTIFDDHQIGVGLFEFLETDLIATTTLADAHAQSEDLVTFALCTTQALAWVNKPYNTGATGTRGALPPTDTGGEDRFTDAIGSPGPSKVSS